MSQVLTERRGPALWVTFNRPEAHNAMTFAMYEDLFAACEQADADDEVRVLVLRGAGEKAFVAGTDIRQFADFDESGADALAYEATIDRIVGRLETVRKPAVALVDGFAMGSGLALSAACDLRICTPAARFGLPIARTVGNCLSMENYARLAALLGPARLKDIVPWLTTTCASTPTFTSRRAGTLLAVTPSRPRPAPNLTAISTKK